MPAIKAYGKIGGTAPFILNWANDMEEFQLYAPTALTPVTHLTEGWVDPRGINRT
jgi:hypothetical protein